MEIHDLFKDYEKGEAWPLLSVINMNLCPRRECLDLIWWHYFAS